LRNPLDTHQDPVDAANARQLYKNSTPVVAPRPVVHAVKHKAEPAPAPSVLSVEVYQGDKQKEEVKFPEQGNEDPK
ncbi:MAG: hypothetical protein WA824_13955, partial [Candidatus Sulfotelmatobacter sp.]